jgi:hypothetical protein
MLELMRRGRGFEDEGGGGPSLKGSIVAAGMRIFTGTYRGDRSFYGSSSRPYASDPHLLEKEAVVKEWTWLTWMVVDYATDAAAVTDLRDMREGGSTAGLNLVAQPLLALRVGRLSVGAS